MYLNSDFADVHFTFPNDDQSEKVPAHKAILASASPVFAAMFFGPLKEADIVKITDSYADAFKEFLQIVYLPKVILTVENHEEVARLADKYDLHDCFNAFIPFIEHHLKIENLILDYQVAVVSNHSKLRASCEQKIRVFAKDVLKSESFLECSREAVKHILAQEVLECNEMDLFEACMSWATAECHRNGIHKINAENLKAALGNCFHYIQFVSLDIVEYCDILSHDVYGGMFTQQELFELWMGRGSPRTSQSRFRPEIFYFFPRSKVINDSTKWICKFKQYKKSVVPNKYLIKTKESTWFSTNEPVVLTSINFSELQTDSGYDQGCDLTSNMEILEYNSNTIEKSAPFEVLHKLQRLYTDTTKFSVPIPPVIIQPNKMYEIRWVFP